MNQRFEVLAETYSATRVLTFPLCCLPGVYSRGAAKSSGDSYHPDLLSEEEVSGDH